MFKPAFAVFALTLASLTAQGTATFIPSDNPATGPCSKVPFGSYLRDPNTSLLSQRIQVVVSAAELGNRAQLISTLAVAPCGTGVRKYDRITISMNHISHPLSTNFASNSGGRIKLLDRFGVVWPNVAGRWNNLPLERSFAYDPLLGDLLIEILVRNGDFSGAVPEMRSDSRTCLIASGFSPIPKTGILSMTSFKMRLGSGIAATDFYGSGCGPGPLALEVRGSPRLGSQVDFRMVGGNPQAAASVGAVFLGFQKRATGLGRGCLLYTDVSHSINVAVHSGASQWVSIALPNMPSIVGGRFYVQGVNIYPGVQSYLDLFVVSNYCAVTVGF